MGEEEDARFIAVSHGHTRLAITTTTMLLISARFAKLRVVFESPVSSRQTVPHNNLLLIQLGVVWEEAPGVHMRIAFSLQTRDRPD